MAREEKTSRGIPRENFYKTFYCHINMCHSRWSRSWFNTSTSVGRTLDISKKEFAMLSILNLPIPLFSFFIRCNSWCWSWKLLWIKRIKKDNLKNLIVLLCFICILYVSYISLFHMFKWVIFCLCFYIYLFLILFLLVLVVSSFIVCKYTYYLAILKYDYLRNKNNIFFFIFEKVSLCSYSFHSNEHKISRNKHKLVSRIWSVLKVQF